VGQTEGVEWWLCARMQAATAFCRSVTDRKLRRRMRRRVRWRRSPRRHSAGAGGRVEHPAGMIGQPGVNVGMLVSGLVVEDGMNDLASRDGALDGFE
jgi:hypothetical protein